MRLSVERVREQSAVARVPAALLKRRQPVVLECLRNGETHFLATSATPSADAETAEVPAAIASIILGEPLQALRNTSDTDAEASSRRILAAELPGLAQRLPQVSRSPHEFLHVKRIRSLQTIPFATRVSVSPDSANDYEILELNASFVEESALAQLRIVYTRAKLPVFVESHGCVWLHVDAIEGVGGDVARLGEGTELVVAPKLRAEPAAGNEPKPITGRCTIVSSRADKHIVYLSRSLASSHFWHGTEVSGQTFAGVVAIERDAITAWEKQTSYWLPCVIRLDAEATTGDDGACFPVIRVGSAIAQQIDTHEHELVRVSIGEVEDGDEEVGLRCEAHELDDLQRLCRVDETSMLVPSHLDTEFLARSARGEYTRRVALTNIKAVAHPVSGSAFACSTSRTDNVKRGDIDTMNATENDEYATAQALSLSLPEPVQAAIASLAAPSHLPAGASVGIALDGARGCGLSTTAQAICIAAERAGVFAVRCGEAGRAARRAMQRAVWSAPAVVVLSGEAADPSIDADALEDTFAELHLTTMPVIVVLVGGGSEAIRVAQRAGLLVSSAASVPLVDQRGRGELLDRALAARNVSLRDAERARAIAVLEGAIPRDVLRFAERCALWGLPDALDAARACSRTTATSSLGGSYVRGASRALTWKNVGGLALARSQLEETVVVPILHRNIFGKAPVKMQRGVLLHGPTGCGKTLLATTLGETFGLRSIVVDGPSLMNKFVGASEEAVRSMFTDAEANAPCVLVIDEIDACCPPRGSDNSGVTDRVVNQFLTQLDGVSPLQGVSVIGVTSRRDAIDPAVLRPGRLDSHILCDFPSAPERQHIFEVLACRVCVADDVDWAALAALADGFTGADLRGVVTSALIRATTEGKSPDDQAVIREEHIRNAIREAAANVRSRPQPRARPPPGSRQTQI